MIQWLRSLLFVVFMYALMAVMGIALAPLAIWSREGAWWALHRYTGVVLLALRWMCGLRVEVRGAVPAGDVVVASKHQSFLDILILTNALPRPRFVMKRSLRWAPVLGFYAWRIGSAPVDRSARSRAVREMVAHISAEEHRSGQIVIFPQGTRVAPDATVEYKPGAAALVRTLGLPCVPASTNGGMFWPRYGILRRPGVAVLEFHAPIRPGLHRKELMARLEEEIEGGSLALMTEAAGR